MNQTEDSLLGQSGCRLVGVEIEFGRLGAVEAAGAVQRRFGGRFVQTGPHSVRVEDTELGNFTVKLDWRWAQPEDGEGPIVQKAKGLLGEIGREVMPTEVVSPPIPAGRIPDMDSLARDLASLGAEGTRAGLLKGFGMHLNPALGPADLAAEPICRVLQAYILEAPALRAAIDVDPMREVLPFVDAFPQAYAERVLNPDYNPSLAELIGDYLHYNPTRNRELDMLPLFAKLDYDRVLGAVPDPHISARPTFHWRLPNADIDDPEWSISREWARWLQVEIAAVDAVGLLERLAEHQERMRLREQAWGHLL